MGLRLATRGLARAVGYVERDAFAAAVLVARMADADLDPAPVWDHVETFDGRPWRGAVDLICAGFPCQPWSQAGKKRGLDDERWIWPELARIIREVRPGLVFLENVPGLASGGGLGPVLGSLAEIGFDAEWDLFRASDVGAPHERARLFILAKLVSDVDRGAVWESTKRGGEVEAERRIAEPRDVGEALADAEHARRVERGAGHDDDRDHALGRDLDRCDPHMADTDRFGGSEGRGLRVRFAEPIGRGFPPGPADADGWRDWLAQGGPEPALRRGAHGLAGGLDFAADRLRVLGNGVVPAQAALAFAILAGRLGLNLD